MERNSLIKIFAGVSMLVFVSLPASSIHAAPLPQVGGWQIFASPEMGYTIQYPQGWQPQEMVQSTLLNGANVPSVQRFGGQVRVITRIQPLPNETIDSVWGNAIPLTLNDGRTALGIERASAGLGDVALGATLEYLVRADGADYILDFVALGTANDAQAQSIFQEMVRSFSVLPSRTYKPITRVPTTAQTDGFDFPLDPKDGSSGRALWYTEYNVVNPYVGGYSPCYGKNLNQLQHTGEDMFRSANSSVYTVANGRAIWAQYANYPGYVVILEHTLPTGITNPWGGNLIYTMYGHLSGNNMVSPWSDVTRGQKIGEVLDQGSNSHLHFEVRRYGDMDGAPSNVNGYAFCNTSWPGPGYAQTGSNPDWYGYTDPSAWLDGHRPGGGGGGGSCSANSDQVALFVDANYGGQCVVKGVGDYANPSATGLPNDAISSVQIGSNVIGRLCRDDNFVNCWDFSQNSTNLGNDPIGDNQISSVKVMTRSGGSCDPNADQIALFVDANYGGQCVVKGIGDYTNPSAIGLPNDAISSVKIGSNVIGRLCRDDGYINCGDFSQNSANLGNEPIGDNQISSARVLARVTPPSVPTLSSPGNGASFNEGDSITLNWSATGDQYYGEIWGGPAGTLTFGWQSGTSNNIGSQWAGNVYSWHIKAKNSSGESNYSDTWNFTVKPSAPANLNASAPSCSQVNLTWGDNSGNEEGYRIYRDGSSINTVGANATGYQDTNASGNTNYTYIVKAYRGSIESDASNAANLTTPACTVAKPDLQPYTMPGYPAPVVPSSIQGTHTTNTLYAGARTFFDWHFINAGNAMAVESFTVRVLVDDQIIVDYPYSNYGVGWSGGFDDWAVTIDTPGTHVVKMTVDPGNAVSESDESNNVWQQTFTWQAINGWKGEYYNTGTLNSNPWLTRDDAAINFDWGTAAPDPSLPVDNFSARWTRTPNFAAGAHRFTILHDDGARLFVDGNKVFENWCGNCSQTETVDVPLTVGNHTVVMEMWENSGWAAAQLSWVNLSVCYDLSVTRAPLGAGYAVINSGTTCTSGAGWAGGTVLTMTPNPSPGYQFSSWSGCDSIAGNVCTVNMTSAKSVAINFTPIPAAAPANDDLANAGVIANLPYQTTQDPTGASLVVDDPNLCTGAPEYPGSGTVWYRYTPARSGVVAISTQGSNYDTMIGVFVGARGSLTRLACNDDALSNRQSLLVLRMTASTTYWIEIADWVAATHSPIKTGASPLAPNTNKSLILTITTGGLDYLPLLQR